MTASPAERTSASSSLLTHRVPAGLKHTPRKRVPSLNDSMSLALTSFRPEHRFGSQCPKSHIARRTPREHAAPLTEGASSSCSKSLVLKSSLSARVCRRDRGILQHATQTRSLSLARCHSESSSDIRVRRGEAGPRRGGCVCCVCCEGGRNTERLCLRRWMAASRLLFGSFFLCRDGMT